MAQLSCKNKLFFRLGLECVGGSRCTWLANSPWSLDSVIRMAKFRDFDHDRNYSFIKWLIRIVKKNELPNAFFFNSNKFFQEHSLFSHMCYIITFELSFRLESFPGKLDPNWPLILLFKRFKLFPRCFYYSYSDLLRTKYRDSLNLPRIHKYIWTRCGYAEQILRFLLISKISWKFWYHIGDGFYEDFRNSYS